MVEKRLLTSLYNTDNAQVVKSWAMLVQDLELEHPVGTVKITSNGGVLSAWYVSKEEKESREEKETNKAYGGDPIRDSLHLEPGMQYCEKCLALVGTHIYRHCDGVIATWPEESPTAEEKIGGISEV